MKNIERLLLPEYKENIEIYELYKNELGIPDSAIYPCCGRDFSPAIVFPKVTFVDVTSHINRYLNNLGLDVIKSEMRDYWKEMNFHDLLILQNAPESISVITNSLKSNSKIIANNGLANAEDIFRKGYDLIGVIFEEQGKFKLTDNVNNFVKDEKTLIGGKKYIFEFNPDIKYKHLVY